MRSVRQDRVLDILSRKEMSTSELCVLVHCTQRSAQEILSRLRIRGLIHRSGWRRQTNGIAALFRSGMGIDAPKPPRMTSTERVRKKRQIETQEEKEFRLARERAARIKPRRDPMIAAFYGEYK